jgi:copper chaperone NosL
MWAAVAAASGGLAPGCAAAPAGPPTIRYGEAVCARCGMTINEARFAAAVRTRGGEAVRFDDIGCLATFLRNPAAAPAAIFVHDYEQEHWMDARRATFVATEALLTPMGYGLAAFDRRDAAEAFARTHAGVVLTWEQVVARVASTRPEERRPRR